jgi:hypothetical protein
MPSQLPDLDAAVRQMYDAFAARPRSVPLDFCAHCVSPQDAEELARTPLRDLSADLLHLFVTNALAETWGDPDDLWYYLPRILEFVVAGEFDNCQISRLFGEMSARWRDWPQDQQDAVTRYLAALWRATIARDWLPGELDAFNMLTAAGDLGVPVDSYLRVWETYSSEAAALHLAWLIRDCCSQWGGNPAAEWPKAIGQWVMGPAPRRVLASALAAGSTPEITANLSDVLAFLDSLGSAA